MKSNSVYGITVQFLISIVYVSGRDKMVSMIVFCGNMGLLAISCVYDLKYKKIPNKCVLCMLALFCTVQAVETLISGTSPNTVLITKSVAGGMAPFIFMLPAEILTKKAFGAGDKKLLFVLGLGTGAWGIIFVMFGMLAVGLAFGAVRRVKRGEYIAMAPFILVSYVAVVTIQ